MEAQFQEHLLLRVVLDAEETRTTVQHQEKPFFYILRRLDAEGVGEDEPPTVNGLSLILKEVPGPFRQPSALFRGLHRTQRLRMP